MRKGPLLSAGAGPVAARDRRDHEEREQISPRDATAAELAVAERVLAAVPGRLQQLLYARVDLLADADGQPVLLELELTEPSLFLWTAPGSVERLADAVAGELYSG